MTPRSFEHASSAYDLTQSWYVFLYSARTRWFDSEELIDPENNYIHENRSVQRIKDRLERVASTTSSKSVKPLCDRLKLKLDSAWAEYCTKWSDEEHVALLQLLAAVDQEFIYHADLPLEQTPLASEVWVEVRTGFETLFRKFRRIPADVVRAAQLICRANGLVWSDDVAPTDQSMLCQLRQIAERVIPQLPQGTTGGASSGASLDHVNLGRLADAVDKALRDRFSVEDLKPPPSDTMLEVYAFLAANQPVTGKKIVQAGYCDQSTLTTHIIPRLRAHYGVSNQGQGYFIEPGFPDPRATQLHWQSSTDSCRGTVAPASAEVSNGS